MITVDHIERYGSLASDAFQILEQAGAISVDMTIEGKVSIQFVADMFFEIPGISYKIKKMRHSYEAVSEFETFTAFCLLTIEDYEKYVVRRESAYDNTL